ncbi:MAG: cytochrome c peroxidase [Caldilineaceae bacterium]
MTVERTIGAEHLSEQTYPDKAHRGKAKTFFSSLAIFILVGLEVITGGLMLYSLRYLYHPARMNQLSSVSAMIEAPLAPVSADIPTVDLATMQAAADSPGLSSEVEMAMSSVFGPLPALAETTDYEVTDALVDLGRHLWYDPRLSGDKSMSCNTCHPLDNYGVDNMQFSLGVNGTTMRRNTPSAYNAALHLAQFWDGRRDTVEEQAIVPILAADEMGMPSPEQAKEIFSAIRGYQPLFAAAFPNDPDPINMVNMVIAIGAFERGLVTPSRFDLFLRGDYAQLNAQEQRGMATFVSLRCPTCHIGATLGGLSFKQIGEREPYPFEDEGRFQVTGLESDKFVFKVPSLRNVTETAPYLHDGSLETLEEVIQFMTRHQLGKTVSDEEVADIIAFLGALTGELPYEDIAKPRLPDMEVNSLRFARPSESTP